MTAVDKTKPDVLRVTEFILNKSKNRESFSVSEESKTKQLNGINEYRIAEIMLEICLDPNGPNSRVKYTSIDAENSHCNQGNWQLNANTYFSYLSHLSLIRSEQSNQTARRSMWIATASIVISVFTIALNYLKII